MSDPSIRVCFVCLGNICRSPTAEGVMAKLVADAGYAGRIAVDSAGTGAYHVGERADARSRAEARRRGIELISVARQFVRGDFERFGYVLALDRQNYRNLAALSRKPAHRDKLHLLRSFDPASPPDSDVPDPYYGGDRGFADVFDLCEAACKGLLAHLVDNHELGRP